MVSPVLSPTELKKLSPLPEDSPTPLKIDPYQMDPYGHPASHTAARAQQLTTLSREGHSELQTPDDSPKSDDLFLAPAPTTSHPAVMDVSLKNDDEVETLPWWSRRRYPGALGFNLAAFFLPALYGLLSKKWIGEIDSGLLSTTDAYTYASIIVEVINEGLPRGLWSTTTNRTTLSLETRLRQVLTLISVQATLGLILMIVFLGAAPAFVGAFVPGEVKNVSVKYIRLSAGSLLASTIEVSVSIGTRAMDHPDVPLAISTVKTLLQIFLELALISKVHVKGFTPTIQTQAIIRLVCDLVAAFAGLAYFLIILSKHCPHVPRDVRSWSSLITLRQLFRPGRWTFLESTIRNAIYLYLVHNVVSMGNTYATAWGVFNTIRWGIIMVPVQALEATSNAFVGHRWGAWPGRETGKRATWREIYHVLQPAMIAVGLALLVEVPICLGLSFSSGAREFARYLSADDEVASVTAMMWKSVDWMYICYAVSTQLATILLATRPAFYLAQSLVSNIGYCLPWAIVIGSATITPDRAWWWHQWVFGGSLVFSLVDILAFVGIWVVVLLRGVRPFARAALKFRRRDSEA